MTDQATTRRCERCGELIPASKRSHARFCSSNCCKRASADRHRGTCTDCGATLFEGAAWNGRAQCRACWKKRVAAGRRARVERVAGMYREGLSQREIATALGCGPKSTPPEIAEARKLGLIGYRYRGYEVAA